MFGNITNMMFKHQTNSLKNSISKFRVLVHCKCGSGGAINFENVFAEVYLHRLFQILFSTCFMFIPFKFMT